MIVKIKNDSGCYDYFDGDSVTQSRSKLDKAELQKISNPETLFLCANEKTPQVYVKDELNGFLCLHIYKKRKPVSWIVTDMRCYLMNDEGKTIEKLN
jgi:hypothetical protein